MEDKLRLEIAAKYPYTMHLGTKENKAELMRLARVKLNLDNPEMGIFAKFEKGQYVGFPWFDTGDGNVHVPPDLWEARTEKELTDVIEVGMIALLSELPDYDEQTREPGSFAPFRAPVPIDKSKLSHPLIEAAYYTYMVYVRERIRCFRMQGHGDTSKSSTLETCYNNAYNALDEAIESSDTFSSEIVQHLRDADAGLRRLYRGARQSSEVGHVWSHLIHAQEIYRELAQGKE